MKISILSVEVVDDGNVVIAFSCDHGHGFAQWAGRIPQVGERCTVEVDVPELLEWGREIVPASQPLYALSQNDQQLWLVLKLESVADDGCAVARIGDSIVLLETVGVPLAPGQFIQVRTNKVILHDVQL